MNPTHGFAKGVSGNPGGRPKINEELRQSLKVYSASALAYLALVVEGKDPKARVADRIRASEVLIDRMYGKASQPICGDEDGNELVITLKGQLMDWAN